jgi:hypothetical protein
MPSYIPLPATKGMTPMVHFFKHSIKSALILFGLLTFSTIVLWMLPEIGIE